jgi:signal peptidase II
MARAATRFLLLLTTVLMVGCDHATKVAAKDALGVGRVVTLVGGWLDLRYTENFDTAFSLTRSWHGPAKAVVLLGATAATMVVLGVIAWSRRQRSTPREHLAYALILAGALGNALDRARRGYVIDFIHVHHWPVFNVADVLVVAGVALLAVSSLPRLARA